MKAFLLKYRVVDILTLCIAIGVFLALYGNVPALFAGVSVAQVLVIMLTALLVHALKAARLFLALYGQKISITEHLALYCKVTPVSMVLPYKVGEFYRMYAYGTHLKSGLKGIGRADHEFPAGAAHLPRAGRAPVPGLPRSAEVLETLLPLEEGDAAAHGRAEGS